MEVLYDTFQIQPPLMDIETTQKTAYSPQTLQHQLKHW